MRRKRNAATSDQQSGAQNPPGRDSGIQKCVGAMESVGRDADTFGGSGFVHDVSL
jgi:hypothetical protein